MELRNSLHLVRAGRRWWRRSFPWGLPSRPRGLSSRVGSPFSRPGRGARRGSSTWRRGMLYARFFASRSVGVGSFFPGCGSVSRCGGPWITVGPARTTSSSMWISSTPSGTVQSHAFAGPSSTRGMVIDPRSNKIFTSTAGWTPGSRVSTRSSSAAAWTTSWTHASTAVMRSGVGDAAAARRSMRRPGLAVRGSWGAQCDGTPAPLGPVHHRPPLRPRSPSRPAPAMHGRWASSTRRRGMLNARFFGEPQRGCGLSPVSAARR